MNFDMIPKQWTEGARFCYYRGCNCQGCYVTEIVETKCIMKTAVLKLVQMYGAPKPEDESPYKPNLLMIIDAIKNGAHTKKDIAKALNLPETTVQGRLTLLFELARTEGFREVNKKHILPEYVLWIKEKDDARNE